MRQKKPARRTTTKTKPPARPAAVRNRVRRPAKVARTPADPPLILVVDDYADARDMYCEYLQFSGFRTAEAKTGVEALSQANALLPDLILMDLSLPEMDGWEATRRLKASAKTRHIPVVALTGHALAGHSESARAAGCDAFVAKPCLPEDLVVEVRRLLASAAPERRAAKPRARS